MRWDGSTHTRTHAARFAGTQKLFLDFLAGNIGRGGERDPVARPDGSRLRMVDGRGRGVASGSARALAPTAKPSHDTRGFQVPPRAIQH